jgi:hypothetical protein
MSFAPQPHFGIQNCVHLLPCCAHFGDDDTHCGHGFDVVAVEITGCWKHRAKLIVALHQLKETNFVGAHVAFRCLRWAASIAANGIGMPAADAQIEHLLQQPQCGLVAMNIVGGQISIDVVLIETALEAVLRRAIDGSGAVIAEARHEAG